MKSKPNHELDKYRVFHPTLGGTPDGALYGYFRVPLRLAVFNVISSGEFHENVEWEHVSVSNSHRCPTWDEMCQIKSMFWDDTETVIQFHPKRSEYVNVHPYCLHLWKPKTEMALPPELYV